eukprot:UN00747
MDALPNTKFKKYSFSVIFYDGSTKQSSPKISHKVMREIRPEDDIVETFKKRLYMNASYLCIALSRRNVSDESLPTLFDNVQDFVKNAANKYGYIARQIALGVHINKQIYVDFQIFVKSNMAKARRRRKSVDIDEDRKYEDSDEDLSELSDEESSDFVQSTGPDPEEQVDDDPSFYANTKK